MDLQLEGRRALVTGGSRGIGLAVARSLATEGVACALFARDPEATERAASALRQETGRQVVAVTGSTTSTRDVAAGVEKAAQALGGLDILVNGAARVNLFGDTQDTYANADEFLMLRDFDEKVVGYLRMARAAAEHMRAGGWGRIINISGSNARLAHKISAGSRNIAIVHLTKSMSVELGRHGITANAVHPHITLTERVNQAFRSQAEAEGVPVAELLAREGERNSIGRLVTAEEVAAVVTFLASPRSAPITGEAIAVGGGFCQCVH